MMFNISRCVQNPPCRLWPEFSVLCDARILPSRSLVWAVSFHAFNSGVKWILSVGERCPKKWTRLKTKKLLRERRMSGGWFVSVLRVGFYNERGVLVEWEKRVPSYERQMLDSDTPWAEYACWMIVKYSIAECDVPTECHILHKWVWRAIFHW